MSAPATPLGKAEEAHGGSEQFGDALRATPCKAGLQGKEGLSPGVCSVPFPRPWCGHLPGVQNPLEGAPSPDIPRQGPARSQRCFERVPMEILGAFCSSGFFPPLKAPSCFNDVIGSSCGFACPNISACSHVPKCLLTHLLQRLFLLNLPEEG